MRKISSQISVAIVCAILGFMLAYQFKVLVNQENAIDINSYNSADITAQIEGYKKEREKLTLKVDELQKKVKNYEEAAAGRDDTSKSLLKELEDTRILTGTVDVEGEGVIIYINPTTGIFGGNSDVRISDKSLVELINELKFAEAEAISINDIRITVGTGIRISGDSISINGESRISPSKNITIKAIGDKNKLETVLDFPGTFQQFKGISEVKYEAKDNLKIEAYKKQHRLQYAKPVKE